MKKERDTAKKIKMRVKLSYAELLQVTLASGSLPAKSRWRKLTESQSFVRVKHCIDGRVFFYRENDPDETTLVQRLDAFRQRYQPVDDDGLPVVARKRKVGNERAGWRKKRQLPQEEIAA